MELAETEFPSPSWKTIDGTIGQYWSDSVNPEYSTYKEIRARRLKVEENGGRRRIVKDGGDPNSPGSRERIATRNAFPSHSVRAVADVQKPDSDCNLKSTVKDRHPESKTRVMWNSNDHELWRQALDRYWTFVKPSNLAIEKEMDQLDVGIVKLMDPQEWYRFLLEKYFRWKYTAPNRYGSTTKMLRSYESNNELRALYGIKDLLFALDKDDIQLCLTLASSIRGLGTAGASGLLTVLFPEHFGTVDQFVVKALIQIPELREKDLIAAMKSESLNLNEGATLIRIMRRKADELNRVFSTTGWTPRKVDMVLWTCAR
jgi:hypothetical protein